MTHQVTRASTARARTAPTRVGAAPRGWAYWARSATTHAASSLARSALTRTAGTIKASPPAITDATAENVSANQAAIASLGAPSGQRARASAPDPTVSSRAA